MYNEKSGRLYRDMKQGKHTFAAWSVANPKNSQHELMPVIRQDWR